MNTLMLSKGLLLDITHLSAKVSRPVLLPVRSLRGCTSYRHLHDCKADACLRLLHLGPAAIGHKPGQYSPTTDIGWQII
ncbi:unnamed protein product [Leptidea sinapis]|uniref:Uncharacterized protein n=1 Tax=Leptidea sinapis TaxID=189913 RepID=A0A5E4PSH8_9NEOP|nr:unnamed protein product [Leptidea sinapis]